MNFLARLLPLALALPLAAQTTPATPPDPLQPLAFLKGTWQAKATGSAGVSSSGDYVFASELKGHILARHTVGIEACKGPASFDCDHNDLFYIFQEAPGQPLKAIYLDNEGHVIRYDVTLPEPTTVIFLSEATQPGPQFRLTYQLKGAIMSGKFQMQMPGQTTWNSYLEWSGPRKP